MKITTAAQLRQEMEKIVDAITADDSLPGQIMQATRINHSEDWDEEGDATRCDTGIADTLDNAESAIKIMIRKK